MSKDDISSALEKFPWTLGLREDHLVLVPGAGYLALRAFGSTMEMKGVSVRALPAESRQPLSGQIEYAIKISQNYELIWQKSGSSWPAHTNGDDLEAFIEPHVLAALDGLRDTQSTSYMFLVRDAFFKAFRILKVEQEELERRVRELGRAADADTDRLVVARSKLEAFNGDRADRMRNLEKVWRAINAWTGLPLSERHQSIGELVDQQLELARANGVAHGVDATPSLVEHGVDLSRSYEIDGIGDVQVAISPDDRMLAHVQVTIGQGSHEGVGVLAFTLDLDENMDPAWENTFSRHGGRPFKDDDFEIVLQVLNSLPENDPDFFAEILKSVAPKYVTAFQVAYERASRKIEKLESWVQDPSLVSGSFRVEQIPGMLDEAHVRMRSLDGQLRSDADRFALLAQAHAEGGDILEVYHQMREAAVPEVDVDSSEPSLVY